MKKIMTIFGAILVATTILTSCDTCTKECSYCDGTGKTKIGPTKGMSCRPCEGDGCWSDQSQIGH